jgi:ammonia channel protein AmtB
MTAIDWAGIAVAVTTIVASFAGSIRWMVKHYLSELKPDGNGGHNLEGRITRLETRVDDIYKLLVEEIKK